jgi:hypothetical protein
MAGQTNQIDHWCYRLVVAFIGSAAMMVILGLIIIALNDPDKVAPLLASMGTAALGAIAGLLAPSPIRSSS